MKLNFAIFKKKALWWVLGALVIFYIFYRLISGGSSTQVVAGSSGPSDAAIQAQSAQAIAALQYGAQGQAIQTQSNAQVAMAELSANSTNIQTQAAVDLGKYTAGLDAQTQAMAFTTQRDIAAINAEYSFDTAKITADTTNHQWDTMASIINNQTIAQRDTALAYIRGTTIQAELSAIPSLKANDRDNALALIAATSSGQGLTYLDPGHSNAYLIPAGGSSAPVYPMSIPNTNITYNALG